MGMFDTVVIPCMHCGKETHLQTKLSVCNMDVIRLTSSLLPHENIVDVIGGLRSNIFCFEDCILLLKDSCEHCGKSNAVEIKDNEMIRVAKPEEATIVEGYFGTYQYVKKGTSPIGLKKEIENRFKLFGQGSLSS